jgi:hypothetical protein
LALDWWWYHGFRNDSRCIAGSPQTGVAKYLGFRCQVSGVRELRCQILKPEH